MHMYWEGQLKLDRETGREEVHRLDALELTGASLSLLELTWAQYLNPFGLTWHRSNSLTLLSPPDLTWTNFDAFELTWNHLKPLEPT